MTSDSRLKPDRGETQRRLRLDAKRESGGARQRNRPSLLHDLLFLLLISGVWIAQAMFGDL